MLPVNFISSHLGLNVSTLIDIVVEKSEPFFFAYLVKFTVNS